MTRLVTAVLAALDVLYAAAAAASATRNDRVLAPATVRRLQLPASPPTLGRR